MTNKIKLYQLKNIKDCKFKAYISQFSDFKTLNNKSHMIKQIYKTIFRDYNFIELSEVDLYNIIQSLIEDKYFLTNQEKEVETNIIHQHLLRYITYEKHSNRKILAKSVYGTVKMIGQGIDQDIELNADIVFDNANCIEIVKFKTGVTELSYKARTEKNLPENDVELYLLRKLGEQLYPNKPIISSFYHLKGKKDTKDIYAQFLSNKNELLKSLNELKGISYPDKKMQKEHDKKIKEIKDVLYFNNSEGNNIISFNYDKSLDNEIIELLNTELTFNSEKCKSGNCDFCNYSTLCGYENNNNDKLEIVKPTKKSNGKVKLTDAQKEIVNAEFGNYRVNAVAGSGKSSSVVTRTIELFDKGYTIDDILLITFTNKGALELKDKIKKLKNINTDKLHIYTFNSFGESIVSKEWEALGFTQKPQLASSIDVNDIIKEMLQMDAYSRIEWLNYKNPLLNYPNAKGAFKQLQIYFNIIKSYSYDIDTFKNEILLKEKEQYENKAELIYEMYAKFNEMLKAKNLLQYQDQILYLIELLENNPNLINEYGFKHVIVDEYQDTDFTQVKLLHLLEKYNEFKSLMVVGDDAQCLIGDTEILTPNGYKQIKDLVKDESVICAMGHGFTTTSNIENVSKKQYIGKIIKITTESGKILQGTPNHMLFTNIIPNENIYHVYLMYKDEFGYRIGRTKGVRNVSKKKRTKDKDLANGFQVRLNQEGGDKIWILKQCDNLKDAIFYEAYYSYKYGIPQYVFDSRTHVKYSKMLDNDMIEKLYSNIDTNNRALKLLNDNNLYLEYPHFVPQATTTKTKTKRKIRYKLNFSMFGSSRKRITDYSHELSFNSIHKEFSNICEKYLNISIKTTKGNTTYYNGRKVSDDYDSLFKMINNIQNDCKNNNIKLNTCIKAKLTDIKYDFQPMTNILVGNSIPIILNEKIIEDKIIKVETVDFNGDVYDININKYRNYIANDIVVHNCIYGFKHTTPENIINFDKQFENVKDIYLLDNFRSTPEICNLANGLIKLNTQRIDKDIISRKANGKQPTLTQYDTLENEYIGITELIKEQIINNTPKYEICVIARTKKELLEIQSYLNKENIPSNIEASELFIDNINVQCIVNLANFFKNNEYDYYLMEYLYLTNNFEDQTNEDIIETTNDFKIKLIEYFNTLETEESQIEYFYSLLAPLVENDDVTKSFVTNLQTKTFYTFNQLLDYLYKVILYHDDTSIEKDENKYNAVTLTTAHSSKGKEWSTVITTINSFKYEDIQNDLSLLEEERRLLFVDITRAKDELYITYNTSQDKSRNKGKYCLFADEINNIISVNE